MTNKQRFFAANRFGGGWYCIMTNKGKGYIFHDTKRASFIIQFVTDKFFVARGTIGRKPRQKVKVTVEFEKLIFDNRL